MGAVSSVPLWHGLPASLSWITESAKTKLIFNESIIRTFNWKSWLFGVVHRRCCKGKRSFDNTHLGWAHSFMHFSFVQNRKIGHPLHCPHQAGRITVLWEMHSIHNHCWLLSFIQLLLRCCWFKSPTTTSQNSIHQITWQIYYIFEA